jgi:hypothetical protein
MSRGVRLAIAARSFAPIMTSMERPTRLNADVRPSACRRRRHPNGDDHVCAELSPYVDRQVSHHAAVRKYLAVERHGREHARQRHARAHGLREIAMVEDHGLPGDHVGRDGAKRNRQLVEIARIAERRDERANELLDLLRDDEPAGHAYSALVHPQFERQRVGHRRELPLDRHALAPALATDGALPIDREHLALDLLGRHAGRERRADERAHARADDAVDGHAELVENSQHPDVRGAFRSAARKHETDPRSRRRRGGRLLRTCSSAHGPSNAAAAANPSPLRS